MEKKYYKFLPDNSMKGSPFFIMGDDDSYLRFYDEDLLPDLEGVVFQLKYGSYADYHTCVGCGRLVSEELMNLFKKYLKPEHKVVFVPVRVTSKEYGDRIYYLMHFEKIFDVIDPENTVYEDIPEEDLKDLIRIEDPFNKNIDLVVIPALDYKGVKDLDVFNWCNYTNNIIVSERVMKEMKKKKLDGGIEFWSVWCYNAE